MAPLPITYDGARKARLTAAAYCGLRDSGLPEPQLRALALEYGGVRLFDGLFAGALANADDDLRERVYLNLVTVAPSCLASNPYLSVTQPDVAATTCLDLAYQLVELVGI